MITRDPFSDLVEIYALDAVDSAERLDFEIHLEICGACRIRLDTAHSVAAELVEDSAPPENVWDRIVEKLDEEAPGSVVRITDLKG